MLYCPLNLMFIIAYIIQKINKIAINNLMISGKLIDRGISPALAQNDQSE
jgi:hypothetical protein